MPIHAVSPIPAMQCQVVAHKKDLEPFLPSLREAEAIAVGFHAGGPDPNRDAVTSLYLAVGGAPVLRLDCANFLPAGLDPLRHLMASPAVKVFARAEITLPFLAALDIYPKPLFDVTLALRLLAISARQEDASPEPDELSAQALPFEASQSPLAHMAEDVAPLLDMRKALIPLIVQNGLTRVADIEFQCAKAVAHMEYRGIYLDAAKWRDLTATVRKEQAAALEALTPWLGGPVLRPTLWGEESHYGHNLDSNASVLKLLHRHGVPAASTARRDLAPYLDHPLVRALRAYRKASKALSSFLQPFPGLVHPVTNRLHPRYAQLTAFSGRMSCHQPNIQQIPRGKAFRECFAAPPGRSLVVADYSQIELRVAAQISQDARMLAAYQAGEDLHLLTASYLAGKPMALVSKQERQEYKAVNLGLIYGMGAEGLRETARQSYGVEMPLEQATVFRRRFFETYRGIYDWHQRIKNSAAREGQTLTGRRFPFRAEAGLPERSNLPVQGTAADIIKKALGLLVGRLDKEIWIVAAVHDEILLECPADRSREAAELLRSSMEEAANSILPDVPTPVEAVISASWAEK